jgi:chromosome segregation ATPase
MESKNETFVEEIKSVQMQLSEAEVKHKSALASNQLIQQEKQVIINERDELEAMVTALEDERESLKNEVRHEKERSCSLKVINQMLQEQVNSAVGDLPGNEKNLRAQLRQMSAELLKMKEDQTNSVECKRYQDQITSLLEEQNTLRERNRILKETIRDNSEAYSAKIVELEKKFEAMEQSNEMLRLKTKYDQIPEDEAKVEMLRLKAKYDPLEPEDEANI